MKLFRRSQISLALAAAMSLQTMLIPVQTMATTEIGIQKQQDEAEGRFISTPYTDEQGNVVPNLEEAVSKEGKRQWLESTTVTPSTAVYSEETGVLTVQNEFAKREFKVPEVGGTAFYTQSYKNMYTEQEFIKKNSKAPDAYLGLYDGGYFTAYEGKTIKRSPDYLYIGGDTADNNAENTFTFDHFEIFEECEEPFDWSPNSKYGSPVAQDWPPKGVRIEFYFNSPTNGKEAFKGTQVKLIYEMYDGIPAMKKRVEITNENEEVITVGKIAPEVLDAKEEMKKQIHLETTYTCGTESTIPINTELACGDKKEEESSPFYGVGEKAHTCYEIGPGYEISKGEDFISFDTYELLFSTYWFELNAKEIKGMYEKLYPWTTDNPLTFHNTGRLTKEIIDHAASVGFEMIIQSYWNWDENYSESMLTRDPAKLDYYKELIDYAHSKGVDIGIYQAQYQLGKYKNQGAEYGSNNQGTWGTWCMATAAFDDYYDNFKNFVKYTGVDAIEIDGPYPGCACGNGELHVNKDKETDPAPDGTDKEIGTPSKYKVHNGYFDSTVKQWENAVKMLCKDMRDMGVYIKVPAWYYLNGGNKGAIGYEEAAWSQPRKEQLIYGRQIMHNSGYGKKLSQSWSHIPFANYQGGGSEAAFSPFAKNIEDYNWVLAQNLGNGIASDYRGQYLYENDGGISQKVIKKWVDFYKKYRGIIDSDLVAIKQATYEKGSDRKTTIGLDTLYHANSKNDREKGLLWVYNQSNEVRTEVITVPMYYTGLTRMKYPNVPIKGSLGKNVHSYGTYPPNYNWIPKQEANYAFPDGTDENVGRAVFKREGISTELLDIDTNGNALLEVTMQPMTFTYYTIYEENEAPNVEVEIGAPTNVITSEVTEKSVKISWDKNVDLVVKEDGKVNPNPTIEVEQFDIYRDGIKVGTTRTNSFVDTGLVENKAYTYTVKAVAVGVEGTESIPVEVTTTLDSIKPTVKTTKAISSTEIQITFDENLDVESASDISHYQISGEVTVNEVKVEGNTVTLWTSEMEALKNYILTIEGLKDSSIAGNVMEKTEVPIVYGFIAKYPLDNIKNNKITNVITKAESEMANGTVVDAEMGKAIAFDGRSTYGDLGNGVFNDRNQYSLSVWINTSSEAKQTILSQGQDGRGLGTSGGVEGNYEVDDLTLAVENGIVKFITSDISANKEVEIEANKPIDLGTWNHVALTNNNGEYTLYLNGEIVGTEQQEGMEIDTQNSLFLGTIKNHAGGGKTDYFNGQMSEATLYNVAVTDDYMKDSYEVNKIYLTNLLKGTKALDSKYFTLESFGNLSHAIAVMDELLIRGNYEVEEAQQAIEQISSAKSNLVKKPEYANVMNVYTFDQAIDTKVYDQLGGNHGVTQNAAKMTMYTPFNRGYHISELRDNSIKISSPIAGKTVYSMDGWFKFDPRSNNTVNNKPYEGAGKQFILSDGALEVFIEEDHLNLKVGEQVSTASTPIKYDEIPNETRQAWNHFALVRDGDSFKLYQNGVEVAAVTSALENTSEVMKLGDTMHVISNDEQVFNGIIDEITFYSAPLTQDEITKQAQNIRFDKAKATNIALGAKVTSQSMSDAFRINDGKVLDLASADTPWTARTSADKVRFGYDFEKPMRIDAISMTEFYRPYGKDIQIRDFERVILIDDKVVFNNDQDGSLGYGVGKDDIFRSFSLGNDMVFKKPIMGQKVDVYVSGFNDQDGKYQPYINVAEIEVYGGEYDPNMSTNLKLEVNGEKIVEMKQGDTINFEVSAENPNIDVTEHEISYAVSEEGMIAIDPINNSIASLVQPDTTRTVKVTANMTVDGVEYTSEPLEVKLLSELDANWKGLSVRNGVWTQNEYKEFVAPITEKDEVLIRKDLKVSEGIIEADVWIGNHKNQSQGLVIGWGDNTSDAAKQQGYEIRIEKDQVRLSKSGIGDYVSVPHSADSSTWMKLKVEFKDGLIKIYVNNQLKITYETDVDIADHSSVGLLASMYPVDASAAAPKFRGFKYSILGEKATIKGKDTIESGKELVVTIGMDQLKELVYAQDIAVSYDSDVFNFLGVEKVGNTEVAAIEESEGNIRLLLANLEGIEQIGETIQLKFKAKSTEKNRISKIKVDKMQVGTVQNNTSSNVEIQGVEHTVVIQKGSIEVDKAELYKVINEAIELVTQAVVGDKPGQYPQEAKDVLQVAIEVAQQIASNSHNQIEIDTATNTLKEAIQNFKEAQVKGDTEDINKDGVINVADLALIAYYYRANSDSDNWEQAKQADVDGNGVIDILDLGRVATQILTK